MPVRPRCWCERIPVLALLASCALGRCADADTRLGAVAMPEPVTTVLLLDYFEEFLNDRDADAFRRKVLARYTEGTLSRLAQSGTTPLRRAAVFSLGLVGSIHVNPLVARALRDEDPVVRNLAQSALWAIWFRADTPENNAALEQVRGMIGKERLDEAVGLASRLIQTAPHFAEAYNQRAIANYYLGRFEASASDCRRVLDKNPYHIGALAGLGKSYLELGRRTEALEVFRRALEIQPFDTDLRETISVLEGRN